MIKHCIAFWLFVVVVRAQADSIGTGFLVSSDGLIATSNHVIEDGQSIRFRFKGQMYEARKVAQDEANDLAILKIEGDFPYLAIKGSEDASIGESIFTVGFPNPGVQGFEPKMTTGVISSLSGVQDDPTCYQISVPVQPGNSGGPLLTKDGDVVGIIKSKLSARVGLATANALPENVNYAVKSDYLNILVKLARSKSTQKEHKLFEKNQADGLKGIDKALACIGIVESASSHRIASRQQTESNNERTFEPESPIWNEFLKELDNDIKLAESVRLIDLDDPWDNYIEIRPKLHSRVQKFMDEWKNAVKGYNAWANGGLIGSAIRDGQYEEEFKRFKEETERCDLKTAKIVRKYLAYHKSARAKIHSLGKYFLPERYNSEFKDMFLDNNVAEIRSDILKESLQAARLLGKDSKYPRSEIVYSDKVGFAFTDPTINDNSGVNLYTFELFEFLKKERMVNSDNNELSILNVSYVSGDPYVISLPATFRSEVQAISSLQQR
jgi:hypothetical protein